MQISSARLVLLLLLVMAKQCTWVVEQPHQSLLKTHKRWDWMCNQVVRASQLKTRYTTETLIPKPKAVQHNQPAARLHA